MPRPRPSVLAGLGVGVIAVALEWRAHGRLPASAVIADPAHSTTIDPAGAVHSIQAADLTMPAGELERIWNLTNLERLARTYWRLLSRVSLGLIRVVYTPTERAVVLIGRPLTLLRLRAPEYELDERHGMVRWRIERGILVARRGRDGKGYLQIDLERGPTRDGRVTAHVAVEVAHFYPMIATRISSAVYTATQSRIHVLVTHAFLRSLARLDLAESRVGRFARSAPGGAAPTRTARR